jgi:NAD-dependent dihydropyrimidine dehydrogenase PreA subunit
MSIFIHIELNPDKLTPDLSAELVQLCPVDIFTLNGDQLEIIQENEDECTLCELCLIHAPAGAISIQKLYKNETLVSHDQ